MKKKIVLINQSCGHLMIDIVNAFYNSGKYDHVALITGKLNKQNIELALSISLDKIKEYDKSSLFSRIYSWAIASIQIFFKLLFKYKNYDLFITSNPPFSTVLPLFLKNKFSLLIYDIYPDILINHRLLKDKFFVTRCWKNANRKVYKKAANIFTISEGMANRLSQYIDKNKIKVIPNWSDTNFLKPIAKEDNPFISNHGLENKFIVLYSGNMGATHDLETIIDVAEKLKNEKDILFLLIGDGFKKEIIESRVKKSSLENCLLLPFQKQENLPYSLGSADIGVITLDKETSSLSVPSKTYSLLAAGVPLLCITTSCSEISRITEEFQIGKTFKPDDVEKITEFILEMRRNKYLHNQYCLNARKASGNFTPRNAFLYIEQDNDYTSRGNKRVDE
jgi:glycosyltransferase involved in cell wall biosynthesis